MTPYPVQLASVRPRDRVKLGVDPLHDYVYTATCFNSPLYNALDALLVSDIAYIARDVCVQATNVFFVDSYFADRVYRVVPANCYMDD